MPLAAGTRLGPYEILSPIGAGGMGEVWKARDTRLDRTVAIKRFTGRHSSRFEQEARAIAALNHPNICTIHDIGPDYLVLEYIEGKRLTSPMPVDEAVRLGIQIATALEEAHRRGILHRDLKPGNIMVTERGTAKLLDFGLAKLVTGADSDVTSTIEGTVMGTAAYMAPEQAQGKPLDERSDIFSFGAVLYEMLSGNRAFAGNSTADVLSGVLRDDPRPLQAPPPLERIVMRCLKKQPGERFQAMAEVRAALEQVLARPAEQQPSIAVLPFANMSSSKDDEYFSDGLAEEILNVLANIPGLKVTARTSSFAFRGEKLDIRKIAETLSVGTLLEGSVRRSGSRVRVTAQLINAADGYHLWSERFDRELTDVFAVQDEIAAAIAGALQLKLVGKPAAAQRHHPTLPAYEAFLKGRHQMFKVTPEGLARAKEYFELAIAEDPKYPEPHSELGMVYYILGAQSMRPPREMMPLARSQVQKALELAPAEPRAHAVLGAVAALYDHDWKEAEEQWRAALVAEYGPPDVHARYALDYLVPLGRFPQAVRELEKVLAQDPLNIAWHSTLALVFNLAGMPERAIAEAQRALEGDENSWLAHSAMSQGYASVGKLAEARAAAENAVRVAPWNTRLLLGLAAILSVVGEKERASELLARVGEISPSSMMMYYLQVSEIDRAADYFAKAIEQREAVAVFFTSSAFLKPLRSSPRWAALAKMLNLPEGSGDTT